MQEPVWRERFAIAYRLHMTVAEIMDMTCWEFLGWREFFKENQK